MFRNQRVFVLLISEQVGRGAGSCGRNCEKRNVVQTNLVVCVWRSDEFLQFCLPERLLLEFTCFYLVLVMTFFSVRLLSNPPPSSHQATPVQKLSLPLWNSFFINLYFLDFIYLFLETGKDHCVVASCTPPTGDLACYPGMCPDWELNQWPFGLWAGTQSTEPHQPGLSLTFFTARKLRSES